MNSDNVKELYEIVNSIPVTRENKKTIDEIKSLLEERRNNKCTRKNKNTYNWSREQKTAN